MDTQPALSRRQVLSLGAMLVAGAGGVLGAACSIGRGSGEPAAPLGEPSGHLTIWSITASQSIPQSALTAFSQAHPKVTIEQTVPPGDFRTVGFITASAGGTPPDLMHLNLDFMPMYVEQGLLTPLTRYIKQGLFGDLNVYLPTIVENGTYKGQTYFLAHRQSVNTSAYNPEVLAKAGVARPPLTWNEIRDAAPRLTRRNPDGNDQLAYSIDIAAGSLNSWFNPLLWQAGGELFTADGKAVMLDQPPAREALEFLVELYVTRRMAAEGKSAFTQGRVGVHFAYAQSQVRDARARDAPWIAVGPVWQAKKRVGFGSLGGWVLSKGRQVDTAAQFLAFSLRPPYVREFLATSVFLPVRKDITLDYFQPQDREWAQKFADEARYMHYDILHPRVREVMPVAAAELIKAVRGQVSPQAALQEATRAGNAVIVQGAG